MNANPVKYQSASRNRVASTEPDPLTTVWDHLRVPETLDELVKSIEDWKDRKMFFPMPGIPRAYFEMPLDFNGEAHPVARFVYSVVGFKMRGTKDKCEKPLCAAVWQFFKEARKTLAIKHPGYDTPILFWRRNAECGQYRDIEAKCDVTAISVRVAIPGYNLQAVAQPDSMNLPFISGGPA